MEHIDYIRYLQSCIQFLLANLKNRPMRKILKHYQKILQQHPTNEPFQQPLVAHYILQSMMLLEKQNNKK
jgi:hypothetical protein